MVKVLFSENLYNFNFCKRRIKINKRQTIKYILNILYIYLTQNQNHAIINTIQRKLKINAYNYSNKSIVPTHNTINILIIDKYVLNYKVI